MMVNKWRRYQVKKDTRVTIVEQLSKSTLKDIKLKAINDIYIIEEEPIETSYDTGASKAVMDAVIDKRLVIPDAYSNWAEKYPCRGRIISKGDKCKYEIKIGDRVIYARLGVMRYELEGKMYCDVRESDIHGIIE